MSECNSILEIGCGRGNLLNSLNPANGIGVDLSTKMITKGQHQYPNLLFTCADTQSFDLSDDTFDVIILSDLLNDLLNIQAVLSYSKNWASLA